MSSGPTAGGTGGGSNSGAGIPSLPHLTPAPSAMHGYIRDVASAYSPYAAAAAGSAALAAAYSEHSKLNLQMS